jgi:hypothetical protein
MTPAAALARAEPSDPFPPHNPITQLTPMPTTDSPVISGNNDPDAPDYTTVKIPTKPPEEFTYQERRADLLRQIRDLGHPSMINQVEAADRYGVSQAQIPKDLDRLAESVREHVVDRDRRAFTVDTVVRRAIQGLLEEEEYRKAARTAMDWDEWLTEFHDLREMERQIETLRQR